MLSELEHAFTQLQEEDGGVKMKQLMMNWDARLLMTQNSFRAKEPVLALRRALLSLGKGSEHTLVMHTHIHFFLKTHSEF